MVTISTTREYPAIQPEVLRDSLRLACSWLTDRSQKQEDQLNGEANSHGFTYAHWRGAFRGEYRAATRSWDFFCPVWHGGQAVKALVLAHRLFGDEQLLAAARLGADFILDKQIQDRSDEDFGLILAFEDYADRINTSAILECLEGLFFLADETGERRYQQAALDALDWVQRKAYLAGEGLFRDSYHPGQRQFVFWKTRDSNDRPMAPGRPLLEDGVLLKGSILAGSPLWRSTFLEVADRLLAEEDPPGNWAHFRPASAISGNIHPRHAFWWGMPMINAWQATGEEKYLACARRAAEWYVKAQRHDGGLIRGTYLDFNTDSFGHERAALPAARSSGSAWTRPRASSATPAPHGWPSIFAKRCSSRTLRMITCAAPSSPRSYHRMAPIARLITCATWLRPFSSRRGSCGF